MKNPKSALVIVSLFSSGLLAPGAVVDLFDTGAQLITPPGNQQVSQTVDLSNSPFVTRTSLVAGGQHTLEINGEARFTATTGGSALPYFSMTQTASVNSPVDLAPAGESYFLLKFKDLRFLSPAQLTLSYVSTQWKYATKVTVPNRSSTAEVWVPISQLMGLPGGIHSVTSFTLSGNLTTTSDKFTLVSITTVPEPGSTLLATLPVALLTLRRKRL